MSETEQHLKLINRFIELANGLARDEKISKKVISSALMTACGIYATYTITGNDGALNQSGIEKLTKIFGDRLKQIQQSKMDDAKIMRPSPEG